MKSFCLVPETPFITDSRVDPRGDADRKAVGGERRQEVDDVVPGSGAHDDGVDLRGGKSEGLGWPAGRPHNPHDHWRLPGFFVPDLVDVDM